MFKGKSGLIAPLIFVAGLITALVAGLGFRLREVTEGPFVFVDTLMWVLCGAAFSYLLYVNGTFQFLFAKVAWVSGAWFPANAEHCATFLRQ